MGKIHITDDLKFKLDKVFSDKPLEKQIEKPIEKIELEKQKPSIKIEKNNDFIKEYGYLRYAKLVFFTSFIGGIGLTLGLKIGRIIFY